LSGIYIHIPFCSKRCNYCDFYLVTNLKLISDFISSLKKEITLYSELYKENEFDTIFFGGGTPSILSPDQIKEILDHLNGCFKISNDCEVTLESNPEDFLDKSSEEYRSAGINRLSLGVQSFLDPELKFLTRQHTSEEAQTVIQNASEYFDNISLDIIYSLPSQTIDSIDRSLSKAIELGVKHISAYTLTYEKKTVLYKSLERKLFTKNTDTAEAKLYNYVSEKLTENGFVHYEVSNFAKKNYRSRHNLKYWHYENYLGFGPSAHSFFNGERWNNFNSIGKYNELLNNGKLPVEEKYEPDLDQRHLEFVMLALRSDGVNFNRYRKIFNEDFFIKFKSQTQELINNKFAESDQERFYLNENGYAVADEIIAKYF
jgi:oxygen-independent coproporphyrinogen-3 oxidase